REQHGGHGSAAERERRFVPAAPPGVHSEHGIDDRRNLLSRRSGGGLRARRRVRVLLRRSAAADHRSGRIADQSARNQMKSPGAVILATPETRNHETEEFAKMSCW